MAGCTVVSKTGWRAILGDAIPRERPAGYKTAAEIAHEIGLSVQSVGPRLLRARREGTIQCVEILIGAHRTWVYKD